jgi:hypothetical protein
MRTAVRLFVFAALVTTIALTIAPPVGGTATAARAEAGPQVPADISGTYAGSITSDNSGQGGPSGGVIVIRREGAMWLVTGGPDETMQMPAEKVVRTGDGLTFQITEASDEPTVLVFDLTVKDTTMAGTISVTRAGSAFTGRLAFTKR